MDVFGVKALVLCVILVCPISSNKVWGFWHVVHVHEILCRQNWTNTDAISVSPDMSGAIDCVKCYPVPTWVCPIQLYLATFGAFCLVRICEITFWTQKDMDGHGFHGQLPTFENNVPVQIGLVLLGFCFYQSLL